MKTAVSIPDPTFARADALAKRFRTSRSDLYTRALDDFIDRHEPESITQQINAVLDEMGQPDSSWVTEAGRRTLAKVEW